MSFSWKQWTQDQIALHNKAIDNLQSTEQLVIENQRLKAENAQLRDQLMALPPTESAKKPKPKRV
jgi:regulator of replication initiation timing